MAWRAGRNVPEWIGNMAFVYERAFFGLHGRRQRTVVRSRALGRAAHVILKYHCDGRSIHWREGRALCSNYRKDILRKGQTNGWRSGYDNVETAAVRRNLEVLPSNDLLKPWQSIGVSGTSWDCALLARAGGVTGKDKISVRYKNVSLSITHFLLPTAVYGLGSEELLQNDVGRII